MTSRFRVFLLSCPAMPLAAHGAVYKCTVDGRTSCQQHPCDAGAAQREVGSAPPAAKPPPAAVRSSPAEPLPAKAGEPRAQAVKSELDAAGREALARVEDALARHRETPAATKSGDGRTSGVLEVAATEAFHDLREGDRDCVLEIVEVR